MHLQPCMFYLATSHFVAAANIEGLLSTAAGNKTILETQIGPAWASSPTFRGTADILWSCIVTLIACIYTALHLNVPQQHESDWQQLVRKAKWATVALFAPELVVHTAWKQYREARKLCSELNELRFPENKPQSSIEDGIKLEKDDKHSIFTMEYGFWVVMGGFVVDCTSIHDKISRVTLTTHGVRLLAKQGHFFEISKEVISGRSKANLLAKALVCAQVGWMVVQCIARKSAGYPITILEVHTMVHVVCALCIYSLWWHKPLDVQEPQVVSMAPCEDIFALMLMACLRRPGPDSLNHLRLYSDISKSYHDFTNSRDMENIPWLPLEWRNSNQSTGQPVGETTDLAASQSLPPVEQHDDLSERFHSWYTLAKPDSVMHVKTGSSLAGGLGPRVYRDRRDRVCGVNMALNHKDVHRWQLAAQALKRPGFQPVVMEAKQRWQWETSQYAGCDRSISISARNIDLPQDSTSRFKWNFDDVTSSYIEDGYLAISAFLLPVVYGGIHLSAWNFDFPTRAEKLIWRTACLIIIGCFPVDFLATLCIIWAKDLWAAVEETIFQVISLLYAVCRLYIVVEAFLSLRHVPLGVYVIPNWIQSIPHL